MRSAPHNADRETQERVRRVVLRAMETLLRDGQGETVQKPLQSFVDRMLRASLGPDPEALSETVRVMRRAGVSNLDVAELYVPRVADVLGMGWSCDELDFGQVAIGSSRLQFLLRQLDDEWAMAHPRRPNDCPAVLIGVPDGVQHTLGASVLAGQLRHRGFSVHLDLQVTPGVIAQQLAKQRYSGVFLSASGVAHLETCRDLVTTCKKASRGTPIVIGGTILDHHEDICGYTGADIATSDVAEALTYCGFDGARLFDPEQALSDRVLPEGVIT